MTHPFSKTFIEMAKVADEIQAMRPPFQPGDAIYVKKWEQTVFVGGVHADKSDGIWSCSGDVEEEGLPSLWIPRLDQLLGMLGVDDDWALNQIITNVRYGGEWHQDTLEILMQKKYSKTWRDGAWHKA